MNQPYTLVITLPATWPSDENNARFIVDNEPALNGYVGWIGLCVSRTKLFCTIAGSLLMNDTDRTLTGHVGAIHFHPQPRTLA